MMPADVHVVPTGMIFIPCKDGISHNEIESAEPEHISAEPTSSSMPCSKVRGDTEMLRNLYTGLMLTLILSWAKFVPFQSLILM